MKTSSRDEIFLAPESIISDPRASSFLRAGPDGFMSFERETAGKYRTQERGYVLRGLRILAARIRGALAPA